MSVQITTPIPSPEEIADSLGLSAERRRFLSDLASNAKPKRSTNSRGFSGMQNLPARRKRSEKKAA